MKKLRLRQEKRTKESPSKTWSDKEIEQLIDLWGKEEVLFNCRHNDYLKTESQAAALQRVVMGKTGA